MEEKESYHWLEALKNTDAIMGDTQVVTVCDREADMYGLFEDWATASNHRCWFGPMWTGPSTGNPDTLKKIVRLVLHAR